MHYNNAYECCMKPDIQPARQTVKNLAIQLCSASVNLLISQPASKKRSQSAVSAAVSWPTNHSVSPHAFDGPM